MRHIARLLVPLAAPLVFCLATGCATRAPQPAPSPPTEADAEPDSTTEDAPGQRESRHRFGQPHRGTARRATDELAAAIRSLKETLEDANVDLDVDLALLTQGIDDTTGGKHWLSTYLWTAAGSWKAVDSGDIGKGELAWYLMGAQGVNYNADRQTATGNAGTSAGLNATDWVQDPITLNDLYWRQRFPGKELTLSLGKMDLSNHFDTNRVANDWFRQFNTLSLVNSPATPFPVQGGFGGLLRWEPDDGQYLMLGVGDSSVSTATVPWNTVKNNSWYEMAEWGGTADVADLGEGTYRVTPWYSEVFDESGWGVGLSVDQELGSDDLVGFLRLGTADDDVVSVEHFASAGFALHGPLRRKQDTVSFGVARAHPSDDALRSETAVEAIYEISLAPSLKLSPGVQYIHDPAARRDTDSVWIFALRIVFEF